MRRARADSSHRGRSLPLWLGACVTCASVAFAPSGARGESSSPARPAAILPLELRYLQYGIAFTAEFVTLPGPICTGGATPCILGSGGGIAARGGTRFPGAWYLGGAYEFSKQDPNQLYRLAILQQLRVETRYYVVTRRIVEPYFAGGLGAAAYGNAWTADVWGALGFLGIGVELQVTRTRVVGLGVSYRGLYTGRFTDTAGTSRSPGVAQILGIDLVLEARDPL